MARHFAAILLAAGESTRMGRPKQLLPWGDVTLIEWQVTNLREAGIDDVIVVLGHDADAIRHAVPALEARLVVNERYREGRASSLRAGAEAVADDATCIVILSVDQPRPTAITAELIAGWRASPSKLVMPARGGRTDHPVLVDGGLLAELRAVTEAELGLRAVVERHRNEAQIIEMIDPWLGTDLNTPADYDAALIRLRHGDSR